MSLLSPSDLHLFNEGRHLRLYQSLGAHLTPHGAPGTPGCHFAVWAPNATQVFVMGDFDGWNAEAHGLTRVGESGIWEGFVAGAELGQHYMYRVMASLDGDDYQVDKADPLAVYANTPPKHASVIWDLDYTWGDTQWMAERAAPNSLQAPMAIYELHLGSWMRVPEQDARPLTYRELAPRLCEYVTALGFTHVELMPIMEHPFYGSWGYQLTGFFAPTSRYGTPQDLMFLVDTLHQAGIGVLLDWVPSHFPADDYGLGFFDGTHLYEHADPRQGFHPEWKSLIFNYGRNEVRSFLLSSAMYWLDLFHADGLRVDGVASMLYRDYSRKDGEWVPNVHGGHENLEAVLLLRTLNEEVARAYPDVQMVAEESTSWPHVTGPMKGELALGFGLKWDMGWMHDTLNYLARAPAARREHHAELTFRQAYAGKENYVLALSHDEVVHGKGPLIERMHGDPAQQRASLRLLYGYQYALPGKKLLFMGDEFGQLRQWDHDTSLDWHLLKQPEHAGLARYVSDLNRLYRSAPALYARDFEAAGFAWLEANDAARSVLTFLRHGVTAADTVVVACNFAPAPHVDYRIGVPAPGFWQELHNSDAEIYGGSGLGNLGGVVANDAPYNGQLHSITPFLPPLSVVMFRLGTAP